MFFKKRMESLSLLEKKQIQWEQEKGELIGLWSPWGRPPSLKASTSCSSLLHVENEVNHLTSSNQRRASVIEQSMSSDSVLMATANLKNFGSQYYLPPIGSGTDSTPQLPRRDFPHVISMDTKSSYGLTNYRKPSLPLSIKTSLADVCNFRNDTSRTESGHWELVKSQKYHGHDEDGNASSGYQSENNNVNNGIDFEILSGSSDSEKDKLKFSQAELSKYTALSNAMYSSRDIMVFANEVEQNADLPSGWKKPGTYLYSKRNEMDHYDPSRSRENQFRNSDSHVYQQPKPWSFNSTNQLHHIPPPAMRSSFTTSIEAPDKDAYKDIKRMEHQKWLKELDQQREEQRRRKQKEAADEKCASSNSQRAKWGDRGVIVGHLWEPASFPDSRLPAPPESKSDGTPNAIINANDSKFSPSNNQIVNSQTTSEDQEHESRLLEMENAIDLNSKRSFILGQNVQLDPIVLAQRLKEKEKALEHQEAIRNQIMERQLKLKEEREKRIEEERSEDAKLLIYRLEQLKKLEMNERQKLITEQEQENFEVFQPIQQLIHNYDAENKHEAFTENSASGTTPIFDSSPIETIQKVTIATGLDNVTPIRQNFISPIPPLSPSIRMDGSVFPKGTESISSIEEYESRISRSDPTTGTLTVETHRSRRTSMNSPTPILLDSGTQTDDIEIRKEDATETKLIHDNRNKKSKKERPKWGIPPPIKQYVKASERDPYYHQRLLRRKDKLKRRETQTSSMTEVVQQNLTMDHLSTEIESPGSGGEETKLLVTNPSPIKSLSEKKTLKKAPIKTKTLVKATTTAWNQRACRDLLEENETQFSYPEIHEPKVKYIEHTNHKIENLQANPITRRQLKTVRHTREIPVKELHEEALDLNFICLPSVSLLHNQALGEYETKSYESKETITDPNFTEESSTTTPYLPPLMTSVNRGHRSNGSSMDSSPKFSPRTLIFESTADYFRNTSNLKEDGLTENRFSLPRTPPSPPLHLKQLMVGLQSLGNFFPSSPSQESHFEVRSNSFREPSNRTIEFTIKLPADYYQRNFECLSGRDGSGISGEDIHVTSTGTTGGRYNNPSVYIDPMVEQRKRQTMDWIRSTTSTDESQNGTLAFDNRRNLLDQLSTLRIGIQNEQEEWESNACELTSDSEGSPYGSTLYTSSVKTGSSN